MLTEPLVENLEKVSWTCRPAAAWIVPLHVTLRCALTPAEMVLSITIPDAAVVVPRLHILLMVLSTLYVSDQLSVPVLDWDTTVCIVMLPKGTKRS